MPAYERQDTNRSQRTASHRTNNRSGRTQEFLEEHVNGGTKSIVWADPDTIIAAGQAGDAADAATSAQRDGGDVPAPAPGDQPTSVMFASVTRHSSKPTGFTTMIERMFPSVPRIELFARGRRPGWDVWGNEAG